MAVAPGGLAHPYFRAPLIPAGLQALYQSCAALYTDQPNPLQVAAVVKYWLGGPDPLDYISMYSHAGDSSLDVPPHWHYVSFGLSDLHGDGRVHDVSGPETPSGFGFELTFRLRKEEGETAPPTWPAAVMQGLAKYVFLSENVLYDGDHVSWHCPLDNSESRIQHMVMSTDPQLGTVSTPFGSVQFVQIVGVCAEELRAAQHWNGRGFLQLMKGVTGAGGPWLVTNMRRNETVFELDSDVEEAVQMGIAQEGSDLSGVGARLSWSEGAYELHTLSSECHGGSQCFEQDQGQDDCKPTMGYSDRGCEGDLRYRNRPPVTSAGNEESSEPPPNCPVDVSQVRPLKALHVMVNLEAGLLLPLMLRGRLKHGRHFTFNSTMDSGALTFVVPSVEGSVVTEEEPFAVLQAVKWCQALIQEDLLEDMIDEFEHLSNLSKEDAENLVLPKTYSFPHHRLSITLLPEEDS